MLHRGVTLPTNWVKFSGKTRGILAAGPKVTCKWSRFCYTYVMHRNSNHLLTTTAVVISVVTAVQRIAASDSPLLPQSTLEWVFTGVALTITAIMVVFIIWMLTND